jgi:crotonobetainyl-CoA:carnitine CoA-transferase CaiB-like acyl-CoA transferase
MGEGDAAPGGALDGIKVLEAGLLVQGPQAAALLGQLGADVVKVELPGFGDMARWLPADPPNEFRSPFFVACNRGKRSLALDLRQPAGRETFLQLVEAADVVITNFKPGTMESWGLGYAELSERNPAIVFATGSAFGPVGPDAAREGTDLSAQAAGGLISATGRDGSEPTPVAVTIADHIASQNLVAGVLAALLARGRTGRGQQVDVSLLGGQIWAQASEYTYHLLTGKLPGRPNRGHPLIAGVYGIFPTSDGWMAIPGVVGEERNRFFHTIGAPQLLDDPRFASPLLAMDDKLALFEEVGKIFSTRTTAEWCEVLRAAGHRFAPVRTYAQVVGDPQAWENGYLARATDASGTEVETVGSPIRLSATPTRVVPDVPELGQHTEEVLLEAGLSWDDIEALRTAGAI